MNFRLKRVGLVLIGNATVKLYEVLDATGADDRPSLPQLAESDPIDMATMTGGPVGGLVSFEFSPAIALDPAKRYAGMVVPQNSPNAAQYLQMRHDVSSVGGMFGPNLFGHAISNTPDIAFGDNLGFIAGSYHSGYDLPHTHGSVGEFLPGTAKLLAPSMAQVAKNWATPIVGPLRVVSPASTTGLTISYDLTSLFQDLVNDPGYALIDPHPLGIVAGVGQDGDPDDNLRESNEIGTIRLFLSWSGIVAVCANATAGSAQRAVATSGAMARAVASASQAQRARVDDGAGSQQRANATAGSKARGIATAGICENTD